MESMPTPGPPPPPPPPRRTPGGHDGRPSTPRFDEGLPKWLVWSVIGVAVILVAVLAFGSKSDAKKVTYSSFMNSAQADKVKSIKFNNATGHIDGTFKDGTKFSTTGLLQFPDPDLATLRKHNVAIATSTPQMNLLEQIAPYLFMFLLVGAFLFWIQRRSAGQMGGIMSVGRSKAKTYDSDSPRTTFADVAGYDGGRRRGSRGGRRRG